MSSDLLTALVTLPWLIPLGFFTFIFLEWSGRDRGEAHLYARLLGQRKEYESKRDSEEEERYNRMP